MRIAITGAAGLFGCALVRIFGERHTVLPLTRADADLTDAGQIRERLREARPEVVIHSAAIRDLDLCEARPAEAFRVNVHGTRNVVDAARAVNASVAYISTDSVFDGQKPAPYSESDPAIPPTVYGRTKLRAEELTAGTPRHLIVRVSVLFGPGKTNMVDKVLAAAARGEEYVAPSDQVGTVTYTLDAARTLRALIESRCCGLYHVCNQGGVGRLEFARRAAGIAGLDTARIVGRPGQEMGRPAARPKHCVMAMRALEQAGLPLPQPWPRALEEYILSRHASPPA